MGEYKTWLIKDGNYSVSEIVVVDEDPDYWYAKNGVPYSKKEYRNFSTKEEANEESQRRMVG